MDTNRLKRFATEARNILIQGVAHRLQAIGFDADGTPIEEPQLFSGGATFMGDTVSTDFYDKWMSLARAIRQRSMKDVAEEAAYTWFNRLMAIRIMVKNNLIPPVLQYESEGVFVPLLVTEARQGRLPVMQEDERRKLIALLDDDSKTAEQFAILIVAFCHANPVINACFGSIKDYTELLLPTNILAEGGLVDLINHTDFIAEEDYKSPELIGWLYQFYISEKKDDVFASFKKGKKAEAEDIPAATQIFTPNWIVKYMVQNTIGRIYLDNNPYEEDIQKNWKYLIEPTEKTPDDKILHYDDLKELKFADLACGSGHILNEGFDMLYDLYILEGYSRKDAIENIFRYNLTGIDIDTRAKQLAQFALLLKACQKDASFADAHTMPQVLDMPEPYPYKDNLRDTLPHFFLGGNQEMIQEVCEAIDLMDQAKNLGSIMKFNISERTRNAIEVRMDEYGRQPSLSDEFEQLKSLMRIILALTAKYAAVVMNPPYMKAANMNDNLKSHVESHYEIARFDMYSVFMKLAMDIVSKNGVISMIVQPTWLVNYTFGELREYIMANFHIDSLLHMGRGNFGNDWGSIAFTLSCNGSNILSHFYKLYERAFYRIEPEHISSLFLCAKKDNEFRYNFANYTSSSFSPQNHPKGKRIYYGCYQDGFSRIKNSPYCYTFTDEIINIINTTKISGNFTPATGLQAGDNSRFVRNWHEVSQNKVLKKWFPYINGGNYRRWYGNLECYVNWENDGYEIKHLFNPETGRLRSRPQSQRFYFREGATWNRIASKRITLRYFPTGCIFDQAGDSLFSDDINSVKVCISYLNTNVAKHFFDMLAPGLNLTAGTIGNLPYIVIDNKDNILQICNDNIAICKEDWDAHEVSWDFKANPLVALCNKFRNEGCSAASYRIENFVKEFEAQWEGLFNELHGNEEELNRQFINIYGLQDELTPDVPKDEITILQQGEISIEDNQIVWHPDVLVKQLISYAVGCMMGRYSIDKPGLILANQSEGIEHYDELVPNSRFDVDDDGIIPLMSAQSDFADNATVRFKNWLTVTFGGEMLVDNLNFIEKSLGKSIDDYFVKDFWKDHKKVYQNRPIYWLFSSKKGAFQCLAYMHRMDAYTAERIRTKYLLPHIEWLMQKQGELEANAANLTNIERKQLDSIIKQIAECREYHDRLHMVADEQIAFDLDDGVVVNYAKFGDVLSKIK